MAKETKTKKPPIKVGIPTGVGTKTLKVRVPRKAKEKVAEAPNTPKRAKDESKVVLRIRVRAYESKILDASVKQIIDTARRYDADIVGPVPLPTEIKKHTGAVRDEDPQKTDRHRQSERKDDRGALQSLASFGG